MVIVAVIESEKYYKGGSMWANIRAEPVDIKMKHLAAYLLLTLGGNDSPSAKDIKSLLASVGIEADSDRLSTLLSELKDKDINAVCTIFQPTIPGTPCLLFNS